MIEDSPITIGGWSHYAITYDTIADIGTIYRNGTVVASGFFGSKATVASNLRKRPSTGTPICLLTKRIWLFDASIFCGACEKAGNTKNTKDTKKS